MNYCVTVLLLNCVRATVSAIRPGSPSVCLLCAYIDLFLLLYLAADK